MEKQHLKVYTALDDTGMYKESLRYRGTYISGVLETEMKYDIFCFDRETDFTTGEHKILINNIPSTFFLWKNPEYQSMDEWRGYLIYDWDPDYEWYKQQFLNRVVVI